jgi:hypothetical protein
MSFELQRTKLRQNKFAIKVSIQGDCECGRKFNDFEELFMDEIDVLKPSLTTVFAIKDYTQRLLYFDVLLLLPLYSRKGVPVPVRKDTCQEPNPARAFQLT